MYIFQTAPSDITKLVIARMYQGGLRKSEDQMVIKIRHHRQDHQNTDKVHGTGMEIVACGRDSLPAKRNKHAAAAADQRLAIDSLGLLKSKVAEMLGSNSGHA